MEIVELGIALFVSSFGGFLGALGVEALWNWTRTRHERASTLTAIQLELEYNRRNLAKILDSHIPSINFSLYRTSSWESALSSGTVETLRGEPCLGQLFRLYHKIRASQELNNFYANIVLQVGSGEQNSELTERTERSIKELQLEIRNEIEEALNHVKRN